MPSGSYTSNLPGHRRHLCASLGPGDILFEVHGHACWTHRGDARVVHLSVRHAGSSRAAQERWCMWLGMVRANDARLDFHPGLLVSCQLDRGMGNIFTLDQAGAWWAGSAAAVSNYAISSIVGDT